MYKIYVLYLVAVLQFVVCENILSYLYMDPHGIVKMSHKLVIKFMRSAGLEILC